MIRHSFAAQTRKPFFLLAVIVCLFVALRLWHLTTYGLWYDEVFSHHAARMGWSELIAYLVADAVHPPLFYLLLKLWIGVGGESLLWLKLLPVLISIASLFPFWLVCRELKLTPAEINTALFLIAVNAFLIEYAQELRMYSLMVFFSLWSLWLFARLITRDDDRKEIFAGLFTANLLLTYTQYFGWLVVVAEGLYLLFRKRRYLFRFALIVVGLALCFAPWAYLVSHAAFAEPALLPHVRWLRPSLSDLGWYFATLNGPFYIRDTTSFGLGLFGFPLLLLAWHVWKGNWQSRVLPVYLLAFFAFAPVIFALVVSCLLPWIWNGRYLIVGAVPYLILVAVAIHQLRPAWIKILMLLIVTAWAGFSCVHRLSHDNDRFNWFALARYMSRTEPVGHRGVSVYAFENFVADAIESALVFLRDERFDVTIIKDVTVLRGDHFWVAFRDTTWKSDRLPQTFLRDSGCHVSQEMTVSTHIPENVTVGEAVTVFPASCLP